MRNDGVENEIISLVSSRQELDPSIRFGDGVTHQRHRPPMGTFPPTERRHFSSFHLSSGRLSKANRNASAHQPVGR